MYFVAGSEQVKATIGNIIVGKPTVNHTGTFRVENKGTALAAVMELVKPPMLALSSKRKLREVCPMGFQMCFCSCTKMDLGMLCWKFAIFEFG